MEKKVQMKGEQCQVYNFYVNRNLSVKLAASSFINLRKVEGNLVLLFHNNTRAIFK